MSDELIVTHIEETPDIVFDSETPDIEFSSYDTETPAINTSTEQHDEDIDDLDEPDQYVETEENGEDDEDTNTGKHFHVYRKKICWWLTKSYFIFNLNLLFLHLDNGPASKKDKAPDNRLLRLPLARVKHIMKLDPDVSIISQESAMLITKATELFIESLAREAFVHTAQAKKKTVQKRDIDAAISSVDALMFLEGAMEF